MWEHFLRSVADKQASWIARQNTLTPRIKVAAQESSALEEIIIYY
jgi:hypothetical protein